MFELVYVVLGVVDLFGIGFVFVLLRGDSGSPKYPLALDAPPEFGFDVVDDDLAPPPPPPPNDVGVPVLADGVVGVGKDVTKEEGEPKSQGEGVVPVEGGVTESRGLDVLGELVSGNVSSAVDGIRELIKKDDNLPMRAILRNPLSFTAVQLHADYSDVLGLPLKAEFMRKLCIWQYQHSVSEKGKRAEQVLDAYKVEMGKDMELKKSGWDKALGHQ